jgi:hypothetical protein
MRSSFTWPIAREARVARFGSEFVISGKDALLHLVLSKLSEIEGLFADAQRIGEICAGTQESVGL